MNIDRDRLERQATVEARLLARRLRGLPQPEVELLTQAFVAAFLRELLANGDIDVSTILRVASRSMDLAIGHSARRDQGASVRTVQ